MRFSRFPWKFRNKRFHSCDDRFCARYSHSIQFAFLFQFPCQKPWHKDRMAKGIFAEKNRPNERTNKRTMEWEKWKNSKCSQSTVNSAAAMLRLLLCYKYYIFSLYFVCVVWCWCVGFFFFFFSVKPFDFVHYNRHGIWHTAKSPQ